MSRRHLPHRIPIMPSGATPSFKDRIRDARSLLVVDFGFLGDSVQLIPTLWELRRHHPGAQLHVLTTRLGGEVLRMLPGLDRIWDMELMPARRTVREQLRCLHALRRERFDAAFNFSGSDRTVFWTWFSGARNRVAVAWGKHHFWTRWLIPDLVDQPDPDLPVARQRQLALTQLGFESGPLRYDLNPGDTAKTRAAALVSDGAVHLSINAAKPLKEWPLDHSIDLTRRMLARFPNLRIIASGSSTRREQQRLRQLGDEVRHPNLTLLPPDLTIPELTAALQRCRLHIGPDSGVMNLATAVGIPTVSFFRDQPGYRSWLPPATGHHAFVGRCRCVDHRDAPCLQSGRAECLAAIRPEMALEVALKYLC